MRIHQNSRGVVTLHQLFIFGLFRGQLFLVLCGGRLKSGGGGTTPDQAVGEGGCHVLFFPSWSIQTRSGLQTKELLGGHESFTGKF
jgi:hypothetical protein